MTIASLWAKIPKFWQTEIISAWNTFVPSFVGAIIWQHLNGGIKLSTDAIGTLMLIAARSGFKSLSVWFWPQVIAWWTARKSK